MEERERQLHLTFDTSVSVYVDVSMEELSKITGMSLECLKGMKNHDVAELAADLKFYGRMVELGQAEFQRDRHMSVSHGDIELAVREVY